MKNTLFAYENRLRNYLVRNNFPEAEDENFITCRADNAYEVFCDARRHGIDVPTAEELANSVLFQDLDFTIEDVVREILATQFEDNFPEDDDVYDLILDEIGEQLDEYRQRYDISWELMGTREGYELKMELINLINDHLHGL